MTKLKKLYWQALTADEAFSEALFEAYGVDAFNMRLRPDLPQPLAALRDAFQAASSYYKLELELQRFEESIKTRAA
jgi:hypothetical protein